MLFVVDLKLPWWRSTHPPRVGEGLPLSNDFRQLIEFAHFASPEIGRTRFRLS